MKAIDPKRNWSRYAGKMPGTILDVISVAGGTLSFIPEKVQRRVSASADFSMTHPWNYSF